MNVNLNQSQSENYKITTFQAKVNVRYQEDAQRVAISIAERYIYIPVASTSTADSYRFFIKENTGEEFQEKPVFVKIEDLAKALKVNQQHLHEVLELKKITRFEELMQARNRVKKVHQRWMMPTKDVWHNLTHFLKAKKMFEADYTFLPNTCRTLLNENLRFFVKPYVIKGDNGKVKFINTTLQLLGSGTSRIFYMCRNILNDKTLANGTTNEKLRLDINQKRSINQEQLTLIKYLLDNGVNGICPCIYVSQDKTQQPIEVLMPAYEGDLYHKLPSLSINEKAWLFIQVLSTIRQMHALKIVHRDIKLTNILIKTLKGLRWSLTDFGAACFLNNSLRSDQFLGTVYYASPEYFLLAPKNKTPDWLKYDMWSMGLLLYQLYYGEHPLDKVVETVTKAYASHQYLIVAGYMENIKIPEATDQISELVNEVLRHLLNPNPKQRWSADEAYSFVEEQHKRLRSAQVLDKEST